MFADIGPYVLVVDDDPDAQEILAHVVRASGFLAKTASNGQIALDMVKEELPALIFLDLMMPLLDGFQVLTQLRSHSNTRDIPIIVLTGMNANSLPGVQMVLQKSNLSLAQLKETLIELLAH